MRAENEGPLSFIAAQDLEKGRAVTIVPSTGIMDYAYVEADADAITLEFTESGRVGSVDMFPIFNRTRFVHVLDTGARGASLYLDVQLIGARTGKFKYTAGGETIPLLIADDAVVVAGNLIPAYQDCDVNNITGL